MHPASPSSRSSRRKFLLGAAAGGVFMLGGRPLFAQASLSRAQFGIGGIDTIFLVPYVAMKKGYFAEAGLDIEHINTQSGPRTRQSVAAGQVLVGMAAAVDAPSVTLAGRPATLICGTDKRVTYANVLVHKDDYDSGKIRSVKDLTGQRMGVTQPQSGSWLMALYLIEKAGLKGKTEVRGLGDLATMLGAIKTKQVGATMATMSMVQQARQEGFGVPILDIANEASWNEAFGGDVPGAGIYVLRDSIQKRPEHIQAVVNGLVKAQDFMNSNTPEAITDLVYADYLSSFQRDAIVSTLATYQKSVWLKDNIITPEAYARLLEIMGGDRQFPDAELKKAPYDQVVDMSFVRKARGIA